MGKASIKHFVFRRWEIRLMSLLLTLMILSYGVKKNSLKEDQKSKIVNTGEESKEQ